MDKHKISDLYYSSDKISLTQLLNSFTKHLDKNIISSLYHKIKRKESDRQIVEYLKPFFINKDVSYESLEKSNFIASGWSKIIKMYLPDKKFHNYLDIGSNNGYITKLFGEKINLKAKHIYGVDLKTFYKQTIIPTSGFIFKNYDGYNLPFDENFFDIITCSMVLHHVQYYNILLASIHRVLKTHGILLLKEHNVTSQGIDNLVYIEHMLYSILEHHMEYEAFIHSYKQYTFSQCAINDILLRFGFKLIAVINKQKINPTKSYYALYYKANIFKGNNK